MPYAPVMIEYQKRLCPHCGHRFGTIFAPSAIRLGPGMRTCVKCGKAFSDGSMEWVELTPKQKREFMFGELFPATAIFLGLAIFSSFVTGSVFVGAAILLFYVVIVSLFFAICWMNIRRSKKRCQLPRPGKTE